MPHLVGRWCQGEQSRLAALPVPGVVGSVLEQVSNPLPTSETITNALKGYRMARATLGMQVFVTVLFVAIGNLAVASERPAKTLWYEVDARGEISLDLYFFWTPSCPHCRQARPFVADLGQEYPWLRVHSFDLSKNRRNVNRYISMARRVGGDASSVPGFIFCGHILVGFDTPDGMGQTLRESLLNCRESVRQNLVSAPESAAEPDADAGAPAALVTQAVPVSLPFLGTVDPASLSLPVFTFLIAGMDAFNPCAFFVLLFLLSVLVHARSRIRILVIGGIFVFFSGFVYFLFMAAWLNIFMLTGELRLITAIAGLVAVAIAVINVKDFFWLRQGVSLSIPESAKPGLFQQMRSLTTASKPATLVLGTITLAVAANAYELLCTAGFPMVYTRILTLNGLDTAAYYLYLVLYNVVYVIPLALIVLLFTFTLGARKLKEREGRTLKLVSGMMMLGLGAVLLAAPEQLNNMLVAVGVLAFALVTSGIMLAVERTTRKRAYDS